MPVTAALPGFVRLVALLIECVSTFAPGRLTHARGQELRHLVQMLGQRARLIMERLRDGTLRRHLNRRRPPRQEPGSRNVAWLESPFPKERYWLPRLIEEAVPISGLFHQWAINHDLPTIFTQAPQLRRALSPIFTALGLRLPKAAAIIPAADPPAADKPPPDNSPPDNSPPDNSPTGNQPTEPASPAPEPERAPDRASEAPVPKRPRHPDAWVHFLTG